jgi:uncharacterized protein (TIGR02328 family)
MRLWHEKLISSLPRQQLLGQHRECCALRGNGWGKKHSTVDYVFKYDLNKLFCYHCKVMKEMTKRGYMVDYNWFIYNYRGRILGYDNFNFFEYDYSPVYSEHDDDYLQECLTNLKNKGIILEIQ